MSGETDLIARREAVARIIDPNAFNEQRFMATRARELRKRLALEQADAILSTLEASDADTVPREGRDIEAAAWDWLDKQYADIERGDDPVDRAYSADEMVDAFHAGTAMLTASHPKPEPVATQLETQEPKSWNGTAKIAEEMRGTVVAALLRQAREYIADALDAMEHSDGRDLLNRIDAAIETQPEASRSPVEEEPFGYWIEQRHADPVLLRKPAYIPEPNERRTVTPLFASLQAASDTERVALARLHRLQHDEAPNAVEPVGGGSIIQWASDEIERLRALTPSPQPQAPSEERQARDAVATIMARCEAIEDAASDELAKDLEPHAAGYFRGEKALAKSIRRHLADMIRFATDTQPVAGGVSLSSPPEGVGS